VEWRKERKCLTRISYANASLQNAAVVPGPVRERASPPPAARLEPKAKRQKYSSAAVESRVPCALESRRILNVRKGSPQNCGCVFTAPLSCCLRGIKHHNVQTCDCTVITPLHYTIAHSRQNLPTQNNQCECVNVTAPCRSRGKHQAKKHNVIKHHDDWIVAFQKSKRQPVNRCLVSSFTPVLVTCFDPRLRGRSDCSKWQINHA
jgi:hypothetical protein